MWEAIVQGWSSVEVDPEVNSVDEQMIPFTGPSAYPYRITYIPEPEGVSMSDYYRTMGKVDVQDQLRTHSDDGGEKFVGWKTKLYDHRQCAMDNIYSSGATFCTKYQRGRSSGSHGHIQII